MTSNLLIGDKKFKPTGYDYDFVNGLDKIESIPSDPNDDLKFFHLANTFGFEIFERYQDAVDEKYGGCEDLKCLKWDDDKNIVTGSNPYAIVLVNQILKDFNFRTATHPELEYILRKNGPD